MTKTADWTLPEIARQLGVTGAKLREYEDEGLVSLIGGEHPRTRLELIVNGEKLGLSLAEIKAMVESRSRVDAGSAGFVEISNSAKKTFGSEEKARQWVRRPTTALSNLSPLEVSLAGAKGFELVLDLLKRIDHGLAV